MTAPPEAYPARLNIDYPEQLDRLSTFFRLIWAVPILIIVGLLTATGNETLVTETGERIQTTGGGIVGGLFAATLLMILFRLRYPRWWFDFARELTRFSARIGAFVFLLTDKYPSTVDEQSVHLDIDYPDVERGLNRWLPLVKWLLAIPHYIVLGVLMIGAIVVGVIAWFSILFTGRYPRALFDYVVGVGRWALRVKRVRVPARHRPVPAVLAQVIDDPVGNADGPSGPMVGKTVLITGGTGGIGKATALGLAGLGARVAITGRDIVRTEDAAREMLAAGGGQVDLFVADLSSQAEVRRLADEMLASLPRLDVLVNNVGGFWNTRHVTVDGLERTFALNHLAPFLLTNLLIDRLKQSATARVVTVSSGAHTLGRIDFDDLQGERSYSGSRAYDQSKLANLLFTYELARRLQGTSVTANALHPGAVSTSFGAEDPATIQRVFVPFVRPLMKSLARGGAHVDPSGLCPRSARGERPLLRQQQTQEIVQAQLRRGGRGTPLAGQRRPGRPTRSGRLNQHYETTILRA